MVDGCVVYVGECGYGSIGGPDPELGTGEGNKGLIELAGIRCGSHFPFSFLMLVLCSWEDRENIRGKNLMLVSAVNPTLIVYQLQGVPKKSIFLKFQDQKCIWKIWTVLDHVR